ncbi:MAG TPA: trimethylamine methyltransferase family protein [Anaerolineales bacterium]|nr:trimethylamine methyltransferase family protein [Anaerolineales bacterium]
MENISERRRLRHRPQVEKDSPQKPVWLGIKGDQYKPLSDRAIERIHHTALDVLEKIGIANPIPELLEALDGKGCVLGHDGRLKFPRPLIEEVIAHAPKEILYYAPNPTHDITISSDKLVFSTSGEAVTILDFHTRTYRPSRLVDLYDAARLVDQLEHIHTFGQPFIASEFSENLLVHNTNIAYAELAGTEKPFHLGMGVAAHLEPIIRLFDLYAGGEGAFLKRPFCSFGGCPIVSPLTFAEDSLQVMIASARLGITYDVAVASQAGATAPAALAGALVQTFAETLACRAVVYLINPRATMAFGMWPFISDLRTGSFTGGGPEQALVMAATAQICNHYGIIANVASGMSDANIPDAQAGAEKAITTLAAALAGGRSISPYPGSVGSLMGSSFEGFVIDNDMIGNVLRVVRGIEVNDETLSFDVIRDTVYGPGHFLGHPQTLSLMKTEFLYPTLSDRRDTTTWERDGSPTIYVQAHERVKRMLRDHYPEYIPRAVDRKIREHFDIRLKPEEMRGGNGRW